MCHVTTCLEHQSEGLAAMLSVVEWVHEARKRENRFKDAKPSYDSQRRELLARGSLVKQFRQPAPAQELLLRAFQEEILGSADRRSSSTPRRQERKTTSP